MDLTPRPDSDYISARPQYILALKIITGVFSGLSLLGALTVILFHVCYSRLWPNKIVRYIVVMLSIADLLVATSHIWGATQTLEKFMEAYHPINGSDFSNTDVQCTTQAVLSIMGTLASFLWTLALVSYVLIVTSMPGKVAEWCQKAAVVALYSIPCWGFPLLLTIVLARFYLLGYAETVDLGWCYVSFSSDVHSHNSHQHLELLFSYELWTWLIIGAIILCIILYITILYCKKYYLRTNENANAAASINDSEAQPITDPRRFRGSNNNERTQNLTSSMGSDINDWINVENPTTQTGRGVNFRPVLAGVFGINFRPVLAGIFLLGFRSISTIIDITIMAKDEKYYHADWIAILVVFAAIGNSLQGFVNMFLFVWCTPQVYNKCPCCTTSGQYQELK